MSTQYETVIGIEIHAELRTASKIFCGCTTEFGGDPNTHTCPICIGMPGVLPVMNEEVVDYAVKAGLALNCDISEFSKMDRKSYFYPDIPKAYQISQYDLPICKEGWVDVNVNGETKRIGITRIHMEEDAGKLMHDQVPGHSLADYNRTGVPLIEIVSEPDMRSSDDAKAYVEKVKSVLEYIEVSDCKMQEGSLRADVNVSVRPVGQKEFGTRAELKNLNSFKAIVKSIEYEVKRQIECIEYGEKVVQETRRWDDAKNQTFSLRSKEDAQDYRYFPEPDLVPVIVPKEKVEAIRKTIPELPDVKAKRYIEEYGLPEYDAAQITASKEMAMFFEGAIKNTTNTKAVSNWMTGDMLGRMNEKMLELKDVKFTPEYLAKLVNLIDNKTITGAIAKKVMEFMFEEGKDPEVIVKEKELVQINDEGAVLQIVQDVIKNNEKAVTDYLGGKTQTIGFMVGQVMKNSKGKANPEMAKQMLEAELAKLG
jgi:aspartyl-tRNA(Asn)/glutamyl-tRNA(Gln) amidotransferase subunit B